VFSGLLTRLELAGCALDDDDDDDPRIVMKAGTDANVAAEFV
jgi:hypothetical protein